MSELVHGVIIIGALWLAGCAFVALAILIAAGLERYERSSEGLPGALYRPDAPFTPSKDRPHIAAMQAANRTPADAEWERRLARWAREVDEEDAS